MESEQLFLMKRGLELFNSEHYWECHEELEHHWLEASHDQVRYVYWAVIQTATCLFHWREGNVNGAWGQLKKASEKFQYIEKNRLESEVLIKSLNWVEYKTIVKRIVEAENKMSIALLHNFKFKFSGNLWA
jgi:predicted metal-dependent hydrolase